jgi:uroporphyrin-3 C-methyltransferase
MFEAKLTALENKSQTVIKPYKLLLGLNFFLLLLVVLILGASLGFYYSITKKTSQAITVLSEKLEKTEQEKIFIDIQFNKLQHHLSQQAIQLEEQHHALQKIALFSQQSQWRINEVTYLIELAQTALSFRHDIVLTESLLERAHHMILDIQDSRLNKLDRAIQSDRHKLESVSIEDINPLFLDLIQLDQRIDTIPLLGFNFVEEEVDSPDDLSDSLPSWKMHLKKSLSQLKDFIIVRKSSNSLSPLIAQEQGEYINQYLHMQLNQAQWALLQRNVEVYQASLSQISLWINRYYVVLNPITQDVLSAITELQEKNIDFPDLEIRKTRYALNALNQSLKGQI